MLGLTPSAVYAILLAECAAARQRTLTKGVPVRILFIDDRMNEVTRQWQLSGCAAKHTLLPFEPFVSVKKTRETMEKQQPDVVVIGYGLGKQNANGTDVICALRESGYAGFVVGNSGDPSQFLQSGVEVDGMADRKPETLKSVLDNLKERKAI